MKNEWRLTRTVAGKVEEILLLNWNGVRIMRGTPHPDGPQGSWEKLELAGAAAATETKRRLDGFFAEGFVEIVPEKAPKAKPAPPAKPQAPLVPSKAAAVNAKPAWMKKLAPPLDKQLAALHKTIVKAGLEHRAAEIEALARPAIFFSVKKAKPAELKSVVSRIGGDPDLPPGMKWPAVKGVQLVFLAQFVLGDMKPLAQQCGLPSAGVVSLFAQLDSAKPSYGEVAFMALLPAASKLVRTPAPSGVVRIEKAGLVTPKLRLTIPPNEEREVASLRLNRNESAAYQDKVFLPSIPEGRVHILGGWPSATTMHGIKGRRFCAQIDSDHHIDFEMGDYETLRFYVPGGTLDATGFARAVCTMSEA